jgi:hypothetical protein
MLTILAAYVVIMAEIACIITTIAEIPVLTDHFRAFTRRFLGSKRLSFAARR